MPGPRDERRPAVHRDAEGALSIGPTWESLAERLIREAQEAGAFDDLPGRGRALRLEDDSAAGDMALAHHVLRQAGMAPPWIEADKEVRRLEVEIAALAARASDPAAEPALRRRRRAALGSKLDEHDAAVARLASLAPTSRQHRRRLDRERLLAELDAPGRGGAAG